MTISDMGGLVKNNTVRRFDRGGKEMNLFSKALIKLGYNDNKRNHTDNTRTVDDYGYELYQSLEYNIKHVKNVDEAFRENPLYVTITR